MRLFTELVLYTSEYSAFNEAEKSEAYLAAKSVTGKK